MKGEESGTLSAMTLKRLILTAVGIAVLALLVVGLTQLGGSSHPPVATRLTLAQMRARLAGSPARLAALHAIDLKGL